MSEPVHRRGSRRRQPGEHLSPVGDADEVGDAEWFAALRNDEGAGPEAWEQGVVSGSSAQLATDLAALAERVAALEDCLVWEVAAGQTARRETAELRERLDALEASTAAPDIVEDDRASVPPAPMPGLDLDDAHRARAAVLEGLRASVRAAGRLLEARRTGPR